MVHCVIACCRWTAACGLWKHGHTYIKELNINVFVPISVQHRISGQILSSDGTRGHVVQLFDKVTPVLRKWRRRRRTGLYRRDISSLPYGWYNTMCKYLTNETDGYSQLSAHLPQMAWTERSTREALDWPDVGPSGRPVGSARVRGLNNSVSTLDTFLLPSRKLYLQFSNEQLSPKQTIYRPIYAHSTTIQCLNVQYIHIYIVVIHNPYGLGLSVQFSIVKEQ